MSTKLMNEMPKNSPQMPPMETENVSFNMFTNSATSIYRTYQIQITLGQRSFVSLLWQVNHRYRHNAAQLIAKETIYIQNLDLHPKCPIYTLK